MPYRFLNARQLACLLILLSHISYAESSITTVAVASNFSATAKALKEDFESRHQYEIRLVFSSSGKLYAQLRNGAPFDILLSADHIKPAKLVEANLADPSHIFTYALGHLVLWAPEEDLSLTEWRAVINRNTGKTETLAVPSILLSPFRGKLAHANPYLAPYGKAAKQVLEALQLQKAFEHRIAQAENINQVYHFVRSGNARLGFIAASQAEIWPSSKRNNQSAPLSELESDRVLNNGQKAKLNSTWVVPNFLYDPIQQDAILMRKAENNDAAVAFFNYLRSSEAEKIIHKFGYH